VSPQPHLFSLILQILHACDVLHCQKSCREAAQGQSTRLQRLRANDARRRARNGLYCARLVLLASLWLGIAEMVSSAQRRQVVRQP
jgi:hypothetical protein